MVGILAVAAIAFACMGILRNCTGSEPDEKGYYVDTVEIRDTVTLPAPVRVERIRVPVPADVDTLGVLRDYFAKNVYQDTVVKTPVLSVVIRDTVQQNGISGREVYYSLKQSVFREKSNGLSLSSTFACKSIPVTLNYERDAWRVSAGYDVVNKMPVFGVGYRFVRW